MDRILSSDTTHSTDSSNQPNTHHSFLTLVPLSISYPQFRRRNILPNVKIRLTIISGLRSHLTIRSKLFKKFIEKKPKKFVIYILDACKYTSFSLHSFVLKNMNLIRQEMAIFLLSCILSLDVTLTEYRYLMIFQEHLFQYMAKRQKKVSNTANNIYFLSYIYSYYYYYITTNFARLS